MDKGVHWPRCLGKKTKKKCFQSGYIFNEKLHCFFNGFNDVMNSGKSVCTFIFIAYLLHNIIHWITETPYDKPLYYTKCLAVSGPVMRPELYEVSLPVDDKWTFPSLSFGQVHLHS